MLELAAGRLGAGVEGLHSSLALIGGGFGGLESLGLRRAFAASLRAHLATVRLDSVFRFGPPRKASGGSGGGSNHRGRDGEGDAGPGGVTSPGRLATPLTLNWATFRKYTVTLWVRPDVTQGGPGDDHPRRPMTLFRLRNGEGAGVEATLSGGASSGVRGQVGEMDLVVTSFLRTSAHKSFSVRCKVAPPIPRAAVEEPGAAGAGSGVGGEVAEGVRLGGWRFVAVSHGQPYVKRSGRLRVSVDGEVVLEKELQYPSGAGPGAKDALSR